MEPSVLRRRLNETIERAKRAVGERRARVDEATRAYEQFLDAVAIPLFKQVANILKVSGYSFTVFTPSGAVRLMSDRRSEDYIEIDLDTSGARPMVIGTSSRARGRRVVEHQQPVAEVDVADLTEEHLLQYLLAALEPFVER